jgi:hypothetical protein
VRCVNGFVGRFVGVRRRGLSQLEVATGVGAGRVAVSRAGASFGMDTSGPRGEIAKTRRSEMLEEKGGREEPRICTDDADQAGNGRSIFVLLSVGWLKQTRGGAIRPPGPAPGPHPSSPLLCVLGRSAGEQDVKA